jgi:hypothetical protein
MVAGIMSYLINKILGGIQGYYPGVPGSISSWTHVNTTPRQIQQTHPLSHITTPVYVSNNCIYVDDPVSKKPIKKTETLDMVLTQFLNAKFPTFEQKIVYHYLNEETALSNEQPFAIDAGYLYKLIPDSRGHTKLDNRSYKKAVLSTISKIERFYQSGITPLEFYSAQSIFVKKNKITMKVPPFWVSARGSTYAFPELLTDIEYQKPSVEDSAIVINPLKFRENQSHFFKRSDRSICLNNHPLEIKVSEKVSAKRMASSLKFAKTIIEQGLNRKAVPARYPTEYLTKEPVPLQQKRHFVNEM